MHLEEGWSRTIPLVSLMMGIVYEGSTAQEAERVRHEDRHAR